MKTLYIIGDSHVEGFKYAQRKLTNKNIQILGSCAAPGKSAQGLHKAINQNIFLKRINSDFIGKADYIAMMFGEIDCAYTIWSRMNINKSDQDTEVNYAIDGIERLANATSPHTKKNVILLGPIIPLVSTYPKDIPKYLARRLEIKINHRDRTDLVLEFCKRLALRANQLGLLYTDINYELLDSRTNLVKNKYRDKGNFHHLGAAISAKLWMNQITKLIGEN